jgi:hypothetical protein
MTEPSYDTSAELQIDGLIEDLRMDSMKFAKSLDGTTPISGRVSSRVGQVLRDAIEQLKVIRQTLDQ